MKPFSEKLQYVALTIGVVVAFVSWFAYHVFYVILPEQRHEILSALSISTLALMISMLALVVSWRTYYSIDNVNNISKMEGNILDNVDYVTSVPEIIRQFPESTPAETQAAMFGSIKEGIEKRSGTAIELADTIQHFLDLAVFLPALFMSNGTSHSKYTRELDGLLANLDKNVGKLSGLNRGSTIQFREAQKLLKGVLRYQQLVGSDEFRIPADLLEVRGPMLRNPVLRTLLNDYIGLFYHKKAIDLLRSSILAGESDPGSIRSIRRMNLGASTLEQGVREKIRSHLSEAHRHFTLARDACGKDLMWLGFICYNEARTAHLEHILGFGAQWKTSMEEAIEWRSSLNRFINEIRCDSRQPSHLAHYFLFEEELARLSYVNMVLGSHPKAGKHDGPLMYRGMDLIQTGTDVAFRPEHCPAQFENKLAPYRQAISAELRSISA